MSDEIAKNDIFDVISDKLEQYLDVKDMIIENEYFEVLGDSVTIFKFLKNANSLIAKKRFQSFLKGFNSNNKPNEYQLTKLYHYIDNDMKAEFIADLFSKVFLSNSKLSCVIMGSIAQSLIENGKDISHEELVCIEALTKFYDYDIKNYRLICAYIDLDMVKHPKRKQKGFENTFALRKFCTERGASNYESINLTLEKAISFQLFDRTTEVNLDMDEDNLDLSSADTYEYLIITSPGEKLNNYIKTLIFSNIENL